MIEVCYELVVKEADTINQMVVSASFYVFDISSKCNNQKG